MIDDKSKTVAFVRVAPPKEIVETCADLKVCGRRELFELLKFRHKYQRLLDQDRKKLKAESDRIEKAANKVELNEEQLEE